MKNLMNSKKLWVAFSIVFLSGIAIGVVVGLFVKPQTSPPERKMPEMMKMRLFRHISEELEFTPEQQVVAQKILTKMSEDIRKFQSDQRPKIKSIIDTAFAEITKILTDDQKVKMTELQERMAKYHNMRREGDKYGPPHHRRGDDRNKFRPKDGEEPFSREKNGDKLERRREGRDRRPLPADGGKKAELVTPPPPKPDNIPDDDPKEVEKR